MRGDTGGGCLLMAVSLALAWILLFLLFSYINGNPVDVPLE